MIDTATDPALAPLLRAIQAALVVPQAVRSEDDIAYMALLWDRRRWCREAAQELCTLPEGLPLADRRMEIGEIARGLRGRVEASPPSYRTSPPARSGPLDFSPYRPRPTVGPPPADLVLSFPGWWFYGEPGAVAERDTPHTVLVADTWDHIRDRITAL